MVAVYGPNGIVTLWHGIIVFSCSDSVTQTLKHVTLLNGGCGLKAPKCRSILDPPDIEHQPTQQPHDATDDQDPANLQDPGKATPIIGQMKAPTFIMDE
jgi:hypothetical protein